MKIVILNKPYDVLSQFRADEKHQTMADFVNDPSLRLAGRLDMDSEGLVFLTDHGGLNHTSRTLKIRNLRLIWFRLKVM